MQLKENDTCHIFCLLSNEAPFHYNSSTQLRIIRLDTPTFLSVSIGLQAVFFLDKPSGQTSST